MFGMVLIEFLCKSTNTLFFRGQGFRWKRKKGQGKGEEKRSIYNVPDKWGQRGKKQKERLELYVYIYSFNLDKMF